VPLPGNANGNDKLPSLVIVNAAFNNVTASSHKIWWPIQGYLSLPDRKSGIKIEKFCCALIVHCSLKEHNFFGNIKS
jgi:hypothetical protein